MGRMTAVEMVNDVLFASGRAMTAEELVGAMRAMFGIRKWDCVDELLFGCSQVEAIARRVERDSDRAWFTRDAAGRYVANPDKRAEALFGDDFSN